MASDSNHSKTAVFPSLSPRNFIGGFTGAYEHHTDDIDKETQFYRRGFVVKLAQQCSNNNHKSPIPEITELIDDIEFKKAAELADKMLTELD